MVTLIPLLNFNNMYRATANLSDHQSSRRQCLAFITKGNKEATEKLSISDVLKILYALQQGTNLRAVCDRFSNKPGPHFDIRRLIVYAQLHGFIKCLKRYPVFTRARAPANVFNKRVDSVLGIRRLFNRRRCADEINWLEPIDLPSLEQIIEDDPNVAIIWR